MLCSYSVCLRLSLCSGHPGPLKLPSHVHSGNQRHRPASPVITICRLRAAGQ